MPIRTATSGSSLALRQPSIERPSVLVMPLASDALVRNPVSGAPIDAVSHRLRRTEPRLPADASLAGRQP